MPLSISTSSRCGRGSCSTLATPSTSLVATSIGFEFPTGLRHVPEPLDRPLDALSKWYGLEIGEEVSQRRIVRLRMPDVTDARPLVLYLHGVPDYFLDH